MTRANSKPRFMQTIYMDVEDANPLIAIAAAKDMGTRELLISTFKDNMFMLALESKVKHVGELDEAAKTDYRQNVVKLFNRCKDQLIALGVNSEHLNLPQ